MSDEQQQPDPDARRRGPGRPKSGKTYLVRLGIDVARRLECAATVRGSTPEILLANISRVVVADRLIDAVLDTTSLYSLFRAFHARGFPDRGFPDRS